MNISSLSHSLFPPPQREPSPDREVRVEIPPELRKWLVDDWDFVTKQKQVCSYTLSLSLLHALSPSYIYMYMYVSYVMYYIGVSSRPRILLCHTNIILIKVRALPLLPIAMSFCDSSFLPVQLIAEGSALLGSCPLSACPPSPPGSLLLFSPLLLMLTCLPSPPMFFSVCT